MAQELQALRAQVQALQQQVVPPAAGAQQPATAGGLTSHQQVGGI
jgi:hypothetical protein